MTTVIFRFTFAGVACMGSCAACAGLRRVQARSQLSGGHENWLRHVIGSKHVLSKKNPVAWPGVHHHLARPGRPSQTLPHVHRQAAFIF